MNKNNALNMKWVVVSYLIAMAIQISLFVFQVANKILSIWNLISTAMMVGIFVFAIKSHFHEKKEKERVKFDEITGGSTVNHFAKTKRSRVEIIIQVIVLVVCLIVSGVFFGVYNKKVDGKILLDAKVISQDGETVVEYEETDEGIAKVEYDYIEVFVKYEFEGKTKTAKIESQTTSEIHVENLKIYVDESD